MTTLTAADLYPKVAHVVPAVEWATMAEDVDAIMRLKQERNAVILAHNYMTPEIFHGVSDIVGDSLALAREAIDVKADVIVLAGVHFMAETAKLLNPGKTVLIPDLRSGCSLAESITPEHVRALRAAHPGVPVVTYVNTSAAVKAESDICCTSGNAVKVIESFGVPKVIMIPDRFLAANVARQTGVEVIVLAHPECPSEVVDEADFAGSTAQMVKFVEAKRPLKVALITECSMSDNVAQAYPELEFVRPCNLCPHMKRNTLAGIRHALETMTNEVIVPAGVADRARLSVERMLAVGK